MGAESISSASAGRRWAAIAVAGILSAVLFWTWREQAPLTRSYRRMKERRQRDRTEPSPESRPGTDPVRE